MSLTTDKITALAPDQASLKAANKLMSASKWPALQVGGNMVWGECQGSGSNPYRTVFDETDHGYKCTCPSRKFPCKHVLALMWMYVDDPAPFTDGQVPEWVTDWLGRRRKTTPAPSQSTEGKSLAAAQQPEPAAKPDPKAEARRKAAAQKRAQATRKALQSAAKDLDQWLDDQTRAGLGTFLNEASDRCRTIAARLVDSKAQALASRLDELPAYLMSLQGEAQLDALIQEFGRIVLICRAWSANPDDPELHRLVATPETRDSLLENPRADRHTSIWQVVGERVATRRDGLVSQSTWLLNLGTQGPGFAHLLDFFPATLGKRSSAYSVGECLNAELVFYPAKAPLRAVIGDRKPDALPDEWPEAGAIPIQGYLDALQKSPWINQWPVLLPEGRLASAGTGLWWQNDSTCLPVSNPPPDHIAGLTLTRTAALWDGLSLSLLSSQSDWGVITYDD